MVRARLRPVLTAGASALAIAALAGCGALTSMNGGGDETETTSAAETTEEFTEADGTTESATTEPAEEEASESTTDAAGDSEIPVAPDVAIDEFALPADQVPFGEGVTSTSQVVTSEETASAEEKAFELSFTYDIPGLTPECTAAVETVDTYSTESEEAAFVTYDVSSAEPYGTAEPQLIVMTVRDQGGTDLASLYSDVADACETNEGEGYSSDATPLTGDEGVHVEMRTGSAQLDLYGVALDHADMHVVVIAIGLSEEDATAFYEAQKDHFETLVG